MSVAAVVLAAGSSKRLGTSKQNVVLGGETLLERSVRIAHLAALAPVFIVIAPGKLPTFGFGATLLINEAAEEGMASSIRTGIAAVIAADFDGVIILACDQPAVTAEHLRRLAGGGEEIIASSYAGRNGVPAYFPRSVFSELMQLSGDIGAREMLRQARAIELKDGDLDIDTEDDLKLARALYASESPVEANRS